MSVGYSPYRMGGPQGLRDDIRTPIASRAELAEKLGVPIADVKYNGTMRSTGEAQYVVTAVMPGGDIMVVGWTNGPLP